MILEESFRRERQVETAEDLKDEFVTMLQVSMQEALRQGLDNISSIDISIDLENGINITRVNKIGGENDTNSCCGEDCCSNEANQ